MAQNPSNEELAKRVKELEQREKEQLMTLEVLQLINETDGLKNLLREFIMLNKKWVGCEAVGLRLKDGPDFPYYDTTGFPDEFVEQERYLCSYDKHGELKRLEDGSPLLECMCGNIICGRFDPSKNFFTEDGSFWSNCTTKLLATTTDSDRQARTRNRCNSSGYESVALIPLRSAGETFGLLQLNDHEIGKYSAEMISMCRRAADQIAGFLAKRQAKEALKKSEIHLKSLINTIPDLVWLKNPEGKYLLCNTRFEQLFGASEEGIKGKTDHDFINKELADYSRYKDKAALAAGKPCKNEVKVKFAIDGHSELLETIETPMLDEEQKIIGILGIGRDITSHRRIETMLKKNESELKQAQSLARIGNWEWNLADDKHKWSEEIYNIYGRELNLPPATYPEVKKYFTPQSWEGLAIHVEKALAEGTAYKYDAEVIRPDGEHRWITTRGNCLRGSNGKLIRLYGTVQDITDRKQAEIRLQESEARFKFLSEASFEGIQIHDKGLILDTNQSFARMFGYDLADDIIGLNIMHRHLTPESLEKAQSLISSGYQGAYEVSAIKCDGTQFPVEIISKNLMYNGKMVRVTAVRDITERKHIEKILKESEEQLRLFIKHTPAAIAMFDRNMNYLAASNRWLMDFHLGENYIIGHSHYEIFPDLSEQIKKIHQRGMNGEVIKEDEARFVRANGAVQWLSWEMRPWYMADNSIGGIIILTEDITARKKNEEERKRLNEQLAQSQKMESIGRLAGGVAHDLNNLLTPIILCSEMMLEDFPKNDENQESAMEIYTAGNRAKDLVRQLLAFSRKQALEFTSVDLNEVINNFKKLLRRTLPENINLSFKLIPDILPVMADVGQIEQVIMNLCVNAADAMIGGGVLTIETDAVEIDNEYMEMHSASKPGAYAMMAVTDTGKGMNKETQKNIFEPFFSTKGERGTGLGLSTVFGIVKQHDGNIWVYSEPERGTVFKIYLPVLQKTVIDEKKVEIVPDLSGNENILLVEDNEQVKKLTQKILVSRGYKVITASNAKEAQEKLTSIDSIDLLLTDVVLTGEINGKGLFEILTKKYPPFKVLYMSGYTDDIIMDHGVLKKGINFIQKPFSNKALTLKVRKVLDENKEDLSA